MSNITENINIIKLLVISVVLTVLSSAIWNVETGKEAYLLASCEEIENRGSRVASAVVSKASDSKSCSSIPIVKSGGFPLAFVYDNLKKSGIGQLTLQDNLYLKPFLTNVVFYIVLVLTIYGVVKSKTLSTLIALIFFSLFITLLSSYYPGYDLITATGEGYCGDISPCKVKVVTGGFPFQYIYDTLGVSVVGHLSLMDTWRFKPFSYNLAFYLTVFTLFKFRRKLKIT